MNKIVGLVGAAVVCVGGYFGLTAAGIIGAPSVMTDEEVAAGLATYAEEINVDGGLRYDDFSRLVSATAVEKTITIRGDSLLDMADINERYHDSRRIQAEDKLCTDEVHRELLRANATANFNWFSADGESIGDMITIRGDEVCAAYE